MIKLDLEQILADLVALGLAYDVDESAGGIVELTVQFAPERMLPMFEADLRRVGPPEWLEVAAAALRRMGRHNAARDCDELVTVAREALTALERGGYRFDFATGEAVEAQSTGGRPRKLLNLVIGQVLGKLDREQWHTPETYAAVRFCVSALGAGRDARQGHDDDALPRFHGLTDARIRRAIERHTPIR